MKLNNLLLIGIAVLVLYFVWKKRQKSTKGSTVMADPNAPANVQPSMAEQRVIFNTCDIVEDFTLGDPMAVSQGDLFNQMFT